MTSDPTLFTFGARAKGAFSLKTSVVLVALAISGFSCARTWAQGAPSSPVIAYTSHKDAAGFALRKPAMLLLGPVGYTVPYAEGKRLVADEGLVDPSTAIAHDVAAQLANRTSGKVAPAPVEVSGDKPQAVTAAGTGARLVVDVLNRGWGTWAHGLHGFFYMYAVRLLVVDPASGKALLNETCIWPSKPEEIVGVSNDELFGDHARELRRRIDVGAQACRAKFLDKVDGLKF